MFPAEGRGILAGAWSLSTRLQSALPELRHAKNLLTALLFPSLTQSELSQGKGGWPVW